MNAAGARAAIGQAARVELREAGGWCEWPLSPEQARAVSDLDCIDIRPTGRPQVWKLRAKDTVGAVRIGRGTSAVQLRIAPKVTVDRLLYLLGYAAEYADWRPAPVEAAERPDLPTAVAYAFTHAAERALLPGVLFGYREVEESLPVLRGRLRAPAQLRRWPGLALPLEVTYDDHTADIPENRLLLGAALRLLRLPGLPAALRARLRLLGSRLDTVTPPVPGAPLPAWSPTRLDRRYQPVLGLAELILRGASYELDDGRRVLVDGLLVRMWQVFETYLGRVLGEELRRQAGGRASPQDRQHCLGRDTRYLLKPDLVHYLPGPDGRMRPAAVVDAKYKTGRPSDDLYQMVTYCVRLGLRDGHLVYADGKPDVVEVPTEGAVIRLHRHVLDLSLPQPDLAAQVAGLASAVLRAGEDHRAAHAGR